MGQTKCQHFLTSIVNDFLSQSFKSCEVRIIRFCLNSLSAHIKIFINKLHMQRNENNENLKILGAQDDHQRGSN